MTRKIVVLSLALLVFGVSATLAGPIGRKDKGASSNGVADPFTACSDPLHANNCGNFATTSTPGPDGTTITQFVTNTGDFGGDPATPGTVVLYDVFTVPGVVTPGSVLTLNLSPADNNFGIFACGNGNGSPEGIFATIRRLVSLLGDAVTHVPGIESDAQLPWLLHFENWRSAAERARGRPANDRVV